jgi:NDP-sugar pyrophosphorylase family protein
MQCIILAGGMGTRMLPLTSNIPKALIPINDLPFISYQLDWLSKQGITDVVICTGHLGEMIQNYVKDGHQWNLSVQYTQETEGSLRGTAGAIRLALDQNMLQDKFFIMYGDSFLPINFKMIYEFFRVHHLEAMMTIYFNENAFDESNVIKLTEGKIIYDKRHVTSHSGNYSYIDYGLSIIQKSLIEQMVLPNTIHKLDSLFNQLSVTNRLHGFEVHQRFFEVGSFQGLQDFTDWVNGKRTNNP